MVHFSAVSNTVLYPNEGRVSFYSLCCVSAALHFVYFWQNSGKPDTVPADPAGAAVVAGLQRGWLTQPG